MDDTGLYDDYNAGYVQELYERFSRNPESVPEAWRAIFSRGPAEVARRGLQVPEALRGNGREGGKGALSQGPTAPAAPGASEAPDARAGGTPPAAEAPESHAPPETPPEVAARPPSDVAESIRRLLPAVDRATALLQAFREHGHRLARIDPLGSEPPGHPQLDPSFFGTSMEELSQVPSSVVMKNDHRDESLAETLLRLRELYGGTVGYEFEHLEDPERVSWLWEAVESERYATPLSREERGWMLERLTQVEGFEQFLHRTYLGQKRFSIEGTDVLVPVLDTAIRELAREGTKEVVLGMAHRGRLNVLVHILGVDYGEIFRGFEGAPHRSEGLMLPDPGTGDVKYHHGASGRYPLSDDGDMRITMAPNPSHLEFVDPVVEGMTRARQFEGDGQDDPQVTTAVVPVLIHGDAAFAAEGVVAETLNLARLEAYATGGTIHVIANNQIGFTTTPGEGRSTDYASDVAKGYDIPVIHVNADDPEACLGAMRLAVAYRLRFHDDVVIDLVGYRRHGHNEGDEPAFTQPRVYERIEEHPTVLTRWARRLTDAGDVSEEEVRSTMDEFQGRLRECQDQVKEEARDHGRAVAAPPSEAVSPRVDTPVAIEVLDEINEAALTAPEGFSVHPKLQRQLDKRRQDFGPEYELEWAHAETLAFGSLIRDGIPVRLTGQDSERGTFSQRHMVLHDVENGAEHVPLASYGEGRFEIYNSPLTETAVLGFEYGYSVGADRDFVLWEAQFGDFVNVAQVIIDQFISSGRSKWGQKSRLTLLLPHGYEGQGPEHSSARLERFLQLGAEDNLRIAYPSTPAQYFHLLRRQALAEDERPLVVLTPKSLLRHPRATSRVAELSEGGFRRVLDDPSLEGREGISRLVLCSGKIYYDLLTAEARDQAEGVAVARVEELYPFPAGALEELVGVYPDLEEVIWTQEEPRNMGALSFIGPRLRAVVPRNLPLRYVARPERASPAEGKPRHHAAEQKRIVHEALDVPLEEEQPPVPDPVEEPAGKAE